MFGLFIVSTRRHSLIKRECTVPRAINRPVCTESSTSAGQGEVPDSGANTRSPVFMSCGVNFGVNCCSLNAL
jgi:hypothetical protein